MKIFVIHGDDTTKSYARLVTFIETAKKRSWEVVYIDEVNASPREVLSTPSLFGDERFFILKDLKKLSEKDFDWINSSNIVGNLVIYSDKKIPATTLKKFKKIEKAEEFSLPFIIFKFLDYVYPGNAKLVLKSFSELATSQAPEFIFSLVSKQIRDLYWSTLKDKPSFPPWKMQKINSVASKFKEGQLKKIIKKLASIDFKAKTGKAIIKDELELLFAEELI